MFGDKGSIMLDSHDARKLLEVAKDYLREHGRDPELETLVERVEYVVQHEEHGASYDHG